MSNHDKLYIATTSMITSVGIDSAMTAASVNAGVSAYQESCYYNKYHRPITAAWVPDAALPPLHEDLRNIEIKGDEKRLIQLSSVALADITPWLPSKTPITLLLAGPESIPARPTPISSDIIKSIGLQSGISFNSKSSCFLPLGRSGVLYAIELAFEFLATNVDTYILVGGVDSYANTGLLAHLDSEDRIAAVDVNNGFVPGEAASFLLLSKQPHKSFLPVSLHRPGLSDESGHMYNNDVPCLGDGLATAVRDAHSYSDGSLIDVIYSSMNGENEFAKEYGAMLIRNSRAFSEQLTHIHPADCYGDIGAASAAVLLSLSARSLSLNKNGASQQMVYCSSDMATRAAICLSRLHML
ncbi:hypothetical protein [Teredinibacter waterburyi]|uniref:hypothetical protein n=1 Tax=Teredinibacter waterburyi TaxID=1500538 RepID=UPI00165F9F69|nr:hypothetical protein [Teredinibacter waterburyi]